MGKVVWSTVIPLIWHSGILYRFCRLNDYPVGFPKTTFWWYIQKILLIFIVRLLSCCPIFSNMVGLASIEHGFYHLLLFVGGRAAWIWSTISTAVKVGCQPQAALSSRRRSFALASLLCLTTSHSIRVSIHKPLHSRACEYYGESISWTQLFDPGPWLHDRGLRTSWRLVSTAAGSEPPRPAAPCHDPTSSLGSILEANPKERNSKTTVPELLSLM